MTEAIIKITAVGGKDAEKNIGLIESATSRLFNAIDRFRKNGGLSALVSGLDGLAAAEQQVGALGNELSSANAKAEELQSTLSKKIDNPYAESTTGANEFVEAAKRARSAVFGTEEAQRKSVEALGNTSSGISSIAGGVGMLGTGGQAAADVLGAGEGIAQAAQGIAAMGAASLPLIGITAGVAVGTALLNKELQESNKRVRDLAKEERDRVAALIQSREDLRSLTAEQAQQQLDDLRFSLEAQRRARQAAIDASQVEISDIRNFGDAVATGASGLGALVGIDFGVFGTATDEITAFNEEVDKTAAEIKRIELEVLPELLRKAAGEELATSRLNALKQQRDLEIQTRNDIRNLTEDQLNDQIQSNNDYRIAQQDYVQSIQDSIVELEKEIKAREQLGANTGGAGALREELIYLKDTALPAAQAELEGFNLEAGRLVGAVAPNVRLLEKQSQALERLNELQSQRNDILKDTGSIDDQLKQLVATRDLTLARQAEIEALRQQRKAEDDEINTQEKAALAAEKQQQQTAKLAAMETEFSSKRTAINNEFMRDQLKALADFQKQEQRLRRDGNLKLLDLQTDLDMNLREAAGRQDVNSFIETLQRGRLQISREARDQGIAAGDRASDFSAQAQAAITNRQNEIAQLETHYRERLEVERRGQEQTLTVAQQFAQLRAGIAERRAAEDALKQQAAESTAFTERYNALMQQRELLQRQFIETDRQVTEAGAKIGRNAGISWLNGAQSATRDWFASSGRSGGAASSPAASLGRGGGAAMPVAFAKGGIATSPTLALLGEKGYPEAVIPFRQSEGIDAALARYGSRPSVFEVTITGNNFGSISTPEDLEKLREVIYLDLADVVNKAFF